MSDREATPADVRGVAILLGRPVNVPDELREAMEATTGSSYAPIGGIQVPCELCKQPMWLGPRQQEHRGEHIEACMFCAASSGLEPDAPNIKHLGGR